MIDLSMPLLCVSACLLGHQVRYDGGHKLQKRILHLPDRYALLAACPEAECGLGIPREPVRLEGRPDRPCVIGIMSGHDYSRALVSWCKLYVKTTDNVDGFILKGRSPSCGIKSEVLSDERVQTAPGVFARAILKAYPLAPVINEEEFRVDAIRESFLHKAEALSEWRQWGKRNIARFHERHLSLAISHSPVLGRSLKGQLNDKPAYIAALMSCLDRKITEAKMAHALRVSRKQGSIAHQSIFDKSYKSRFSAKC